MEVSTFAEFPLVLLAAWIVMFRCFSPEAEGGVEVVAANWAAPIALHGAALLGVLVRCQCWW